jgi:hypothetical protein
VKLSVLMSGRKTMFMAFITFLCFGVALTLFLAGLTIRVWPVWVPAESRANRFEGVHFCESDERKS